MTVQQYNECVREFADRLFRFALKNVGDSDLAQDFVQDASERFFGTATPSTDIRYEAMARYASETIGLPVRYAVEEGSSRDKVVFQLGPISIERTRSKK